MVVVIVFNVRWYLSSEFHFVFVYILVPIFCYLDFGFIQFVFILFIRCHRWNWWSDNDYEFLLKAVHSHFCCQVCVSVGDSNYLFNSVGTRFWFVGFSAKSCCFFLVYISHLKFVNLFLSTYSGKMSSLNAIVAEFIQCRAIMSWVPVRCVMKFARFVIYHSVFWSCSKSFHFLFWFFF